MDARRMRQFWDLPLDVNGVPQERLNLENKNRSNLFPWNGQFSPELVELLLLEYAPPECFVLDPFVGSGTVVCEAGRIGHSAFGAEINPAALKMAQTYRFINVGAREREDVVLEVEQILDALFDARSLFNPTSAADEGTARDVRFIADRLRSI